MRRLIGYLGRMIEQMRHALFVDHDEAPEARMSDAMEVDESCGFFPGRPINFHNKESSDHDHQY